MLTAIRLLGRIGPGDTEQIQSQNLVSTKLCFKQARATGRILRVYDHLQLLFPGLASNRSTKELFRKFQENLICAILRDYHDFS